MKRRLKEDRASARNLEEAIKNMRIKDMDLKYFQNFAESITKRIQWVIENNGEMTKY